MHGLPPQPVTPEVLEPVERPRPVSGTADPAWDEIVDPPLRARERAHPHRLELEMESLRERQLRHAYPVALGVGLLALPALAGG